MVLRAPNKFTVNGPTRFDPTLALSIGSLRSDACARKWPGQTRVGSRQALMSNVQKVNLLMVARAAGLSKATVSRALRDDPRQSVATRRRVHAVARELGYRPHPMVTALMTQIRTTRRTRFHGNLAVLDPWP